MTFNNPRKRLHQTAIACCTAFLTYLTSAHTLALGSEVEFADAAICRLDLIDVPLALKTARSNNANADDETPLNLEADTIEADSTDKLVLQGNAQITQGARGVYAEQILYHTDTNRASADGNVVLYTGDGDQINADRIAMGVDTFIGEAEGVEMKIAKRGASTDTHDVYARTRATAERIQFEGNTQRLMNVSLSSCTEDNDDVRLTAKTIELNHATDIGTAKSMTVRFKRIPIFYFPRVSFVLGDQRKTGFLFPSGGYDSDSGLILAAPYYLNLAPQYDATLTPRMLSKRGAQLHGQFRYLGTHSRMQTYAELLPADKQHDDEDRYAFGYTHDYEINRDWRARIDFEEISDDAYLRDFSSDIDLIASSYFEKNAELDYFGNALRFNVRARAYESTNESVIQASEQPHEVLPQIQVALKPYRFGWLEFAADAEYTNFEHDDRVSGNRTRVKPSIRMPWQKSYAYLKPSASLQVTRYSLDDKPTRADHSPSATVPIFSLDGRMFFERQLERNTKQYSHTLEPRLFYVNIPERRDQCDFPNFDAGSGSNSSFDHYFRENRFFDGDRVGDTEQLSLGLTNRIIDDNGEQRLNLSIGKIFYRQDRIIDTDACASTAVGKTKADRENASGLIMEMNMMITSSWGLRGFMRTDTSTSDVDAFRVAAKYDRNRRQNASFAYVYDIASNDADQTDPRTRIEQLNFAFASPFGSRWQLQTNVAYSLERDALSSSAIDVSFDDCCWAIRFGVQRYLDGNDTYKNRFVVTLELDDLGQTASRL